MKKNKIGLIILCLILLIPINVYGSNYKLPEPTYDFYVYDEANLIDLSVKEYIVNTNELLYKQTGAQVVVATVNSLENMDINLYATKLFEKWQIGSKKYDNGLLILIAPTERELWIEVGYGLEGALPDIKVSRIINDSMTPYFSEEDYSSGILSGFNQIIDNIELEYNIELNRNELDNDLYDFGVKSEGNNILNSFGTIFLIIGVIIFLIIDFKLFHGAITYSLIRSIGRGGFSSWDSNSSSGSRNSGGGGRSGGGGAGGKW